MYPNDPNQPQPIVIKQETSDVLPLNGFKLITLIPLFSVFGGDGISQYVAVVDRGIEFDRFVVVNVLDPTNHDWDRSISYHDHAREAVDAAFAYAHLKVTR